MRVLKLIIESFKKDYKIKEIRRGLYWTAVWSKYCGLSSTMFYEYCNEDEDDTIEPLTGRSAIEIAKFALSENIMKASLGLASINSLIEIDQSKCIEINASEIIMNIGKNKNISIVGHFPFVDRLKNIANNLWVIEKRPKPGDYPVEAAKKFLPQSDIIAISSTTLINHTFSKLLKLCPPKSIKILLGPTTPMTEIFFEFNIDIISGSRVTNPSVILKFISEGANFRQLKSTGYIKLLTISRKKLRVLKNSYLPLL